MTIQGFTVTRSNFSWPPERHEVQSFLKYELESYATDNPWTGDRWKDMTIKQRAELVRKIHGFDVLHIDAVRGASLTFSK